MTRAPCIVEVAGLAGSGKTALTRLLCQEETFQAGARLRARSIRNLPDVLVQGLYLLPTVVHLFRSSRWFTPEEIKKIVYLEVWHRALIRQSNDANAVVVVEQGAVFNLATLYGFGPEWLRGERFEKWWSRLFDQWSEVLHTVFFLDAPTDVLVERIRSRQKQHVIKERPEHEMREFLSRYLDAYQHVLSQLTARRPLEVVRIDSGSDSLRAIAAKVSDTLRAEFVQSRNPPPEP